VLLNKGASGLTAGRTEDGRP